MDCIEYNSEQAARFVTGIEGWVDRQGRFWGKDEHMARWSGCTHKPCEDCGASTVKGYVRCEKCRDKRALERYQALEKRIWNEEAPVYSEAHDQWFFDEQSVWEYVEEHETTIDKLQLVTSKPQYLRELDVDYFVDELPEDDYNLPDEVQAAMDALNAVIKKAHPVSWVPDKYAAIVREPEE